MKQPIPNVALILASAALIAGLSACGERATSKSTKAGEAGKPDPSAIVIGTAPAPPTGDPPGTTPVASGTSDVSAATESRSKPQEGDENSHSTLANKTPQKADGNNTTQQRSTP
jgi:hypothetical protein